MHLIQVKERILDYFYHLSVYDYIAYGWLTGILVGFLLISIVLAGKNTKASLLMILIVLMLMTIGPFGVKYVLDQTIRKVILVDKNITELPFAKNLIVLGKIKNLGKIDMNACRIFVDILKKDENEYKQILYKIKPLRKEILLIDKHLKKGENMEYKIVFDHFTLHDNYLVRQSVECF